MEGIKEPIILSNITKQQLASMMDLTLLRIDTTYGDIERVCMEAVQFHMAAVAVHPVNVSLAADILRGTPVKVCAALSFYLGQYPVEIKEFEVRDAVKKGADELDMVINVGALKSGRFDIIKAELEALVRAAEGRVTKVILETALLTDDEIIRGCQMIKEVGVNFVKTSTGFREPGAVLSKVALIRRTVGPEMGVKAAGGIRTAEQALAFLKAGANRLGVSSGVKILKEVEK
jgi:deoxyribose-phosphate aldolase